MDLDDLGGEICLLDWGDDHYASVSAIPVPKSSQHVQLMYGCVSMLVVQETASVGSKSFKPRVVPIEGEASAWEGGAECSLCLHNFAGNPMILPLLPAVKDAVGADIAGIPVKD